MSSARPAPKDVAKMAYESGLKKYSAPVGLAAFVLNLAVKDQCGSLLKLDKVSFKSKTKGIATLGYSQSKTKDDFDWSKINTEQLEESAYALINGGGCSLSALESSESSIPMGLGYPALDTLCAFQLAELEGALAGPLPTLAEVSAIKILKCGHKKSKSSVEIFFEIGAAAEASVGDRCKSKISAVSGVGSSLSSQSNRQMTLLQSTADDMINELLSILQDKGALSADLATVKSNESLMNSLTDRANRQLNYFQNVSYTRGLFAAKQVRID